MQRKITHQPEFHRGLRGALLGVAMTSALACGAPDTRVAHNAAPTLADGEGFVALTVKTTHGARIFLKDRTTGKNMFLYAPLGEETFAVHKLPQGKYCLDKIDWLERSLNGVPPSMRLDRQHECIEVAANKLSYGGRWEVSLNTVGEMRVTSTLDPDAMKARLQKNYATLSEQYPLYIPDDTEWTFDYLNTSS